MAKNSNLHNAKTAKNDEFYTQLTDIEKELKHYKKHFEGKVVYCNCDDVRWSNFFKYFSMNFEHLGLKKLICTAYNENGQGIVYEYNGDLNGNRILLFTKEGLFFSEGECIMLFPSKDQRDWSKFNPSKPKFDPKTFQPFDKVLVRDINSEKWKIQLFSHIIKDCFPYEYHCIGSCYNFCIPNNDDTKHLVGTFEEAPEFYRYWED